MVVVDVLDVGLAELELDVDVPELVVDEVVEEVRVLDQSSSSYSS